MNADFKLINIDDGYSDCGGAPVLPPEARRNALGFKSAPRVQGNFVAVAEKKVLTWLAERIPAWMNSDHLTGTGAGGQLLVGCSYLLARWNRWGLLLAIFFLAVNWFGDSLDGTLARHRDQQRPRYGFYVDHVLDSLGSLFLCAGLAVSGYMHPLVAMAMLVAFLMLSVETYLATYTLSKFQMSHWIFGPTEIRIILAIGNLALFSARTVGAFGRPRLSSVRHRWRVRRGWHGINVRDRCDSAHRHALPTGATVSVRRWLKFNVVGAFGTAVQLGTLVLLKSALHMNYLLATALAVEISVLHNFVWHERYTWPDRALSGWRGRLRRPCGFSLNQRIGFDRWKPAADATFRRSAQDPVLHCQCRGDCDVRAGKLRAGGSRGVRGKSKAFSLQRHGDTEKTID